MIVERVRNFIEKYKLKGTFIVAFSGGYDSMCLLDILSDYNDLVAIHLNHNWRGEESRLEEENCRRFAVSKGIKFYSETLPDTVEKTETAARNARYEFFEKCAKKFNSNVVFTAHNLDDNVETVIYRIIKGTGTAGLRGILEKRDIFYRPLLTTTREEIELYCAKNNLTPNNDSSNENIKYKRNLIRKKIIPIMKEINPNVIKSVNSLSKIADYDYNLLSCVNNNEFDNYKIRKMLIEHNIDYDCKKIGEIKNFIDENITSKSGKTLSLTKDLWLFVSNKSIEVINQNLKTDTKISIIKEGNYEFEDYIFTIKPLNKFFEFPKDSEFKAIVSIDKIDFTLRHRQDGDFIQPLGTDGIQKIKKYLNEKKVPKHKKDSIVFLCNGNEVLWAAGLGISDKIKVKNQPTHLIELRKK